MQVLITGANGKIGRMLRAIWGNGAQTKFQPIWSSRTTTNLTDLVWDIESGTAPKIASGTVILHLAGVVRGDALALRSNRSMALKVCAAAQDAGAKHVFLASSAAVYRASPSELVEVHAPAPQSDYGRAKLDMEREALSWAHEAGPKAPGLTCLRIGNVLGADALFGQAKPAQDIVLDPALGSAAGPQRSYLGPRTLAQIIAGLLDQVAQGGALPPILNIATPTPIYMADLLNEAQLPYRFGPVRSGVIPKVCLSTKRLAGLVPLPTMNARAIVDDWRSTMAAVA
jgi:nucleoside-diphosphate-sugar epimerase